MVEFFENSPALTTIFIFIAGIILSVISFFIKKLFMKSKNRFFIKAGGNINAGGDITVGNKNTKITNINPGIKSEKNPFIVLYVRNVKNYPKRKQKIKDDGYLITHTIKKTTNGNTYEAIESSDYFLRLRNEGEEVALNVKMESNNFIIQKYQSKQISLSDEQSVKVVKKPNNKIRSLKELEGEIFTICCDSQAGKHFCFKYKINNIENEDINFLGKTNE